MPISAPPPRSSSHNNYTNYPSPDAAGLVSFILPGLGQIWGGERRKGALFLTAHLINLTALTVIVCSQWILKSLANFGQANEMQLNQQLSQSFADLGVASPSSVIVALLLLSFAFFAARDAFDHSAQKKRQAIYHDYVLAMPEATSGSYIFHVSFLLACLVLAFFFLIPPAPRTQVTTIEFTQNEENTKEKPITNKRAEHNSKAAGKHDPTRPTERASAQKANAGSKSSETSHSQSKSQSKVEVDKVVPPPKPVEARKTIDQPQPKVQAPASNSAPVPQPHPLALTQPASLPKPANISPTAAAPKPNLPAIAPTISSSSPTAQNPLMPPPDAGKSPGPAPLPVPVNKIAMAMPGPALPHSPGRSNAASTPAVPGPPTAVAVTSGGTDGAPKSPTLAAVRSGSKAGTGPTGSSDGPAPTRGTKMGPGAGPSQTTISGPVLTKDPGTGSQNNPGGGPRPGNSEDVVGEPDWPPYMADLQRRIKRCWYPPKHTESKRVKVIFTLTNEGELTNLRLLTSSGLALADQAALKAVEAAAPFRHLPAHAPASVDIEFTFDYNVYSGGSMR